MNEFFIWLAMIALIYVVMVLGLLAEKWMDRWESNGR